MCVCHPQIIPFICVQSNHVSSPVIPRINPWIVWKLDRVSLASYYIYKCIYTYIYIHIYILFPPIDFSLKLFTSSAQAQGGGFESSESSFGRCLLWAGAFSTALLPYFLCSVSLLRKLGCYVQIHYQVLLVGGWMMVVTSPCGWVAVGDDSLCCLEVVWRLDGTCHQIP